MVDDEIKEMQKMFTTRWIVQHTLQGTHPTILAVCKTEESAKEYVSLMEKQDSELAFGLKIYACLIEM